MTRIPEVRSATSSQPSQPKAQNELQVTQVLKISIITKPGLDQGKLTMQAKLEDGSKTQFEFSNESMQDRISQYLIQPLRFQSRYFSGKQMENIISFYSKHGLLSEANQGFTDDIARINEKLKLLAKKPD